jgi:hypothetical protein
MTFESNSNPQPFNVSAADLVDVIDSITDSAMQGVEKAKMAISTLPPDAHPILNDLMARFRSIGFAADATVADCNADLDAAWGVAA